MTSKTTQIFLHNFRCTGNTLNNLLSYHFRNDYLKLGTIGPNFFTYEDVLKRAKEKQPKFILGHNCFGLHQHLEYPCRYFVNFRKPIDRLASGFIVWLHQSKASNFSSYYAEHSEKKNGFVKRLIGIGKNPYGWFDYTTNSSLKAEPEMNENDLERAKKNLDDFCDNIFFTEYFVEACILFEKKNGFKPLVLLDSMNFNRSHSFLNTQHLRKEWIEEIEQNNQLDQKLYDHAMNRFQNELKTLTESDFENVRTRKILQEMFKVTNKDLLDNQDIGHCLERGIQELAHFEMQKEIADILNLIRFDPALPLEAWKIIKEHSLPLLSPEAQDYLNHLVNLDSHNNPK